ncbi:unnamed protein product, partial [marine sediment metagenome]
QKRDGSYETLEMGSVEYSCAEWIKPLGTRTIFVPGMEEYGEPVLKPLDEMKFTLVGGEWKQILFEITPPRKAKGGYSAAVLCGSIQKEEKEEEEIPEELKKALEEGAEVREITSSIGMRASSIILLTVEKRKRPQQLRTKDVEFTGTVETTEDGKGVRIIGSLTNKSEVHIFGKGKLKIRRKGGRRIEYPLGSGRGGVLRGSTVDFASMFKEAGPGEYEADLRIFYGARRPVRIKIPFSVTREEITGGFARTIDFDVPDVIEKEIPPGGHRVFTIPVMNYEAADTIHVKARPIAFRFDEFGELVLEKEGPLSALSLTTLGWPLDKETGECEFDLRPGRWTRVKVEVDLSDLSRDASGGRYVGVEFDGEKEGVEGITTLSSSVLLTMPGELEKKGELVDMRVFRSEGTGFMNFWVGFKNTGNIHVSPTGKIALKKWNDELEGEGGFEELGEISFEEVSVPVLPDDTRLLKAVYSEELELGKYAMSIVIEGIDEPLKLEKEFTIKP